MILLCTGVLIAGTTYYAQAVSYDVTATVPAPALSQPAVIASPVSQLHFSSTPITVTGSCPSDSYVKLFRNNNFSGVDVCTSGQTFQIQTSLEPGTNLLQVQDFNLTDQAGPPSGAVTIYYDLPPPSVTDSPSTPTPQTLPVVLEVASIDLAEYGNSSDPVPQVSTQPTVSGYAPPFSDVTVIFHSDPVECRTRADGKGLWTCALPSELPPGLHTVEISAITPRGKKLIFQPFQVKVVLGLASLVKTPTRLLAVTGDYKYRLWRAGQLASFDVNLAGGSGPFRVSVDWGDGKTSETIESSTSFTVSHTYSGTGQYRVIVKVLDNKNLSSTLQLTASVKGTALPIAPAATQSTLSRLFDSLQTWLWLAWPVYIAIVLMVISFWIGERQAYQRVLIRVRSTTTLPKKGRGKIR